eukprot:10152998-Ditylum_brightwellii.AAC.1
MGNLQQQEIDLDYWQAALCCRDVHIAIDGSIAQKRGYYAVVFHTNDKQQHGSSNHHKEVHATWDHIPPVS